MQLTGPRAPCRPRSILEQRKAGRVRCVRVAAESLAGKRVVIIGGTGRVGSSTADALLTSFPDIQVTVAGRSRESYEAAVGRRPTLAAAAWQAVDINSDASVQVRSIVLSCVQLGGRQGCLSSVSLHASPSLHAHSLNRTHAGSAEGQGPGHPRSRSVPAEPEPSGVGASADRACCVCGRVR